MSKHDTRCGNPDCTMCYPAPPAPEPDDRGNGESDGGQVDAPEPPATADAAWADEAWEALIDVHDAVHATVDEARRCKRCYYSDQLDIIRAALSLATPPPLDVEVLRAFIGTIHPDGLPCVCVQAILDFLDTGVPLTDLVHYDSSAILAGDHKTGEPQP